MIGWLRRRRHEHKWESGVMFVRSFEMDVWTGATTPITYGLVEFCLCGAVQTRTIETAAEVEKLRRSGFGTIPFK